MFLRYEQQAGRLSLDGCNQATADVIAYIDAEKEQRPYLKDFLGAWGNACGNEFLLKSPERQ